MNYETRLEELEAKIESVGLNEAEQAELALIHSYCLLALMKEYKAASAKLEKIGAELKR